MHQLQKRAHRLKNTLNQYIATLKKSLNIDHNYKESLKPLLGS